MNALLDSINNAQREASRLTREREYIMDAIREAMITGDLKKLQVLSDIRFMEIRNRYTKVVAVDVYTIEDFKEACETNCFTDDDGHGYPVLEGKADTSRCVYPSEVNHIPREATHVVWYNK